MEIKGGAFVKSTALGGTSSPSEKRKSDVDFDLPAVGRRESVQATFSGRALMLARIFGSQEGEPEVQRRLTRTNSGMPIANFLNESDRDLLSALYEEARRQELNLMYVDDLASDLSRFRIYGPIAANVNSGMFDDHGRQQTFRFSEKDSVIAKRILEGNKLAGGALDADFIRFLLDPGLSFNHATNFGFLEEVVNKFTNGVGFTPKIDGIYASYHSQGKSNFLVEISADVMMPIIKSDFIYSKGVFHITDVGRENGFRLVKGQPVQISTAAQFLKR